MAISVPVTIGENSGLGAGGSIALTTTATVPAGGKIWVFVGWVGNAGDSVTSVADGTNTYRLDRQATWSDFAFVCIASADAPAQLTSGATITATFSDAGPTDRFICGAYSTGVATGDTDYGGVDQVAGAVPAWASSTTSVTANDILMGFSFNAFGPFTSTASGGNTEIHDLSVGGSTAVTSTYQIPGTTGSIQAEGTWTGGTNALTAAVAYPVASAALGRRYKRFVGPTALSSTPETLYTVPTNGRSVIRNIYANNPSGADAALTLGIQSEDQVTISIAASGDDGRVNTNPTGSYPPSGLAVTTTDGDLWNVKQFTGGNYRTSMSFFRFDTSVIPDDATITSAVLRMRVAGGAVDTDNRSMNFEWHPWTTLATSDFIEEAGTTAGSIDITALALLATGDVEDILSLTDPDANIDKTGYTGLRVGISGGAPTGINEVYLRAIDNATNHEAQLVVTYVAGNSIFDEDTVPAGDILFARRDTNYVLEAGEMLQGFADLVGSDLRNNIFEGGSDGTTITAGNSGGVSGDAFDSIVNGGAGTIIFDNEHSQGSLAMKIITSAGSDTIYGLWDSLGLLTGDVYFRQYLYLTAYPAVIVRVGGCLTGGGAEVGQLNITDTGIVRAETDVTNNYAPGTVPVALNQWIRLEWRIRPAASATQQMEWRLYNNADSATITDTNSTSTATGNANIDQALWGVSETLAPSSYTFWVDNIAVSTDGWIGTAPSVVLVVDGVEYGL